MHSARVSFIFVTILLDALGVGLLIPIFPDVIRRFGTDPQFVDEYFGYFISVYALMQLTAAPVLGSLSDRFGRRPVLLGSLLGAGLDYILMAVAPTLTWLFIGRIVAGLTGASITVASSYMADISDDSNRSANFGLIGAGWGLGFILGPLLGGLLSSYGATVLFCVAAGLNLLNFAFGLFILPESLPPEKRRSLDLARMNPFASVLRILKPSPISSWVWVYFLVYLAGQVHPSVWTLYTQKKFSWTATQVGLSLSYVGLTVAIVQGGLTQFFINRWGEAKSMRVGLVFNILSFTLIALATEGWMLYAIMTVAALSGLAGPALQSLISKDTPSEEQGELQGSLISLASVTGFLGPLLYTQLLAHFTAGSTGWQFTGAPYLAAALICGSCFAFLRNKSTS